MQNNLPTFTQAFELYQSRINGCGEGIAFDCFPCYAICRFYSDGTKEYYTRRYKRAAFLLARVNKKNAGDIIAVYVVDYKLNRVITTFEKTPVMP